MTRPRTVSGRHGLPTILLLDADEDARAMLRDALLEGARAATLRSVADLGELEARLPDATLVLVDLDLAGDAGLRAIRAAKSSSPRTPVVALTRRVDDERVAAAYDAGANTVLPRPVTFLALVRAMKVFTAYWLESAALPRAVA